MIVVGINGGLGNQMLQFAAGRTLSTLRRTNLYLDTYQLDLGAFGQHETSRVFELNVFPGCRDAERLRLPLIDRIADWPGFARQVYSSYAKRCFPGMGIDCFNGYRTTDVNEFHQLPDGTYLRGHYFSAQFFSPIAAQIRADFAFPAITDVRNEAVAEAIGDSMSVSLHIRRGDYLHPANTNFAGVCTPAYYQRAIRYIEERVPYPKYYVFGEDLDWAERKLNLPQGRYTLIDHNLAGRAFEDMRLMSLCDHHIIANSTFSWWGAWLNNRDKKIVVTPQNWYRNYTGPSEDLIVPKGWVKV